MSDIHAELGPPETRPPAEAAPLPAYKACRSQYRAHAHSAGLCARETMPAGQAQGY